MSVRGDIRIMEDTFKADGAISQYRVVKYSSTQGFVSAAVAKDANLAGVSQHSTSASGDTLRVRQLGKTLITIAKAVTKGIPLIVWDSQGRVSNDGGATGDGVIGVTEEGGAGSAGASGDTITCFLQIRRA